MSSLLLANVRESSHGLGDILIRDGRIIDRGIDLARDHVKVPMIDGGGALVLPALVDGHVHLDKTHTGLPWMAHRAGPQRISRIETEQALRGELPPVEVRAANLLRRCIAHGTCALRAHVDVTPELGLAHLEAMLSLREQFAGRVSLQLVAFPQTGVSSQPGVLTLLDEALSQGAEFVGGIDPITFDGGVDEQLDRIFELAERHHAGVDVHIHDPGERGMQEIEAITHRAKAHSMAGKVTVSHGFALGAIDDERLDAVADAMAEAGVSLVTHGGGASPLPPVKRLRERGVTVFAGNDNVRDSWNPFGDGDMLERAMLLAWRSGFRTDADLAIAFDCASHAAARALGLERHGVELGARANLVTVASENIAEAVVTRAPRSLVVHAGELVARDGQLLFGP